MRRIVIQAVCFLLFTALLCATALAEKEQFEFTLLKDGSGYELTRYTGASPVAIIPAEYEGLPVMKIADRAFTEAGHVIMILTDKNQATFYAEDGVLFTDDPVKTLVRFPNAWKQQGASYQVPEGTVAIAPWAFSGQRTLAYLHIPEGVVSIGDYAFAEVDNEMVNMVVHFPASLKTIGKKLTQNKKINIAFKAPKDAPILQYAHKNMIPSTIYLPEHTPEETTVAFGEPDRTEAEDPGLPEAPKTVRVSEYVKAGYGTGMPRHYDLRPLQAGNPDEIHIPLKDHWQEIALKEAGKTANGYPPQTGLYGVGYTEEEMILRGYDEKGNIAGVRRVNGDFAFSLPGTYDLGVSGGRNSHVTVVPYEPTIITEPGTFVPAQDSFMTGSGECRPFRIFILKYPAAVFSIDAPPQADSVTFSLQDTKGVPNGSTDHYTLMMFFLDDPYILGSSEQITLSFHRMEVLYDKEDFRFRASPLFTEITPDYGEKVHSLLKLLKELMIGIYYPADGPVNKITVSLNGQYPASNESEVFLSKDYEQYTKQHIEDYLHEMVHAIDQSCAAFDFVPPSAWQEGRAVYIAEKACKAMKIKSGTSYTKKSLSFLTDEDKADFYRYFYESSDRWTSYPVGYMFVKYLCGKYGEDILGKIEDNVNHAYYSMTSDNMATFRECVTSVTDPDVFQNFVKDLGL